jgi:hypothetical protein
LSKQRRLEAGFKEAYLISNPKAELKVRCSSKLGKASREWRAS